MRTIGSFALRRAIMPSRLSINVSEMIGFHSRHPIAGTDQEHLCCHELQLHRNSLAPAERPTFAVTPRIHPQLQ